MLQLTPQQVEQVRGLTDRLYPLLHPDVRLYLNEQLLTSKYYWEYEEWVERVQLTVKAIEEPSVTRTRKSRKVSSHQ